MKIRKIPKKQFTVSLRVSDIQDIKRRSRTHGVSQVSIIEYAIREYYRSAPMTPVDPKLVEKRREQRKNREHQKFQTMPITFKLHPDDTMLLHQLKEMQKRPIQQIMDDAIRQYFKSRKRSVFDALMGR